MMYTGKHWNYGESDCTKRSSLMKFPINSVKPSLGPGINSIVPYLSIFPS